MSIAIHYEPNIEWHAKRVHQFSTGLNTLGLEHEITSSRQRVAEHSILFGTTLWRGIEEERDFLLVDRASIGDPDYVSLVWNNHGRRGDHCVPDQVDSSRWNALGVELQPRVAPFERTVICGQTEPYSPHFKSMSEWYDTITPGYWRGLGATHFRPHPQGDNPTFLPTYRGWEANFHVLNSSVGVEAAIRGLPLMVHDEGCMAHGIKDRQEWANWLAWTQWRWDEIESGLPIKHLFEEL